MMGWRGGGGWYRHEGGLFYSIIHRGLHLNARLAQLGMSPSRAAGKPICARSHASYYRSCSVSSRPRAFFRRVPSVISIMLVSAAVVVVAVSLGHIVRLRCVIIRGVELEKHTFCLTRTEKKKRPRPVTRNCPVFPQTPRIKKT